MSNEAKTGSLAGQGDANVVIVLLQFALMSRKGFSAGKRRTKAEVAAGSPPKEKFLDALFKNVRMLDVDEKWKEQLVALGILAYGAPFKEREDHCLVAISLVETITGKGSSR